MSDGAEHTRFFTEMLHDVVEPTIPFSLSDTNKDRTVISEAHLKLSQTLCDQLHMHSRNLHVSLASICHLAWAQVLSKASGQDAVVFGTVLLNTLPLRLDIDKRSVETAVHDTHARLSALLAHENASLALAQRCSGVPASLPLFSALMHYHHSQAIITDEAERTNYPLILTLEDDGSSLVLKAQVNSAISATRICAYMQQALVSLADSLIQSPQRSLNTLAIIPTEERTLLLHSWNQTKATHVPCCLHELFEAQVERDGQAIAVECNGDVLSYVELNSKSNQLAHYLISRGVKPDDRIALCAERNLKLVIAILGILKSGCAYVPLDPVYPSQRLTNILHDANPNFLLADAVGRAVLGDHKVSVVDLEQTLTSALSGCNPELTKLELTPAHLAYIIYTSGTTGTPKGVMIEHRNVTNCLLWIKGTFTVEDFEHISFSTSINFDMSLYECFAALSMGTTLHVIPNALALSKSSNFSILNTVPSAVTALLNADSLSEPLHCLHLAGEPLKANLIKCIFNQTQITELCNLYGLTETSLFSMAYRFKRGDEIFETIGRPIANTRIYLLDAHGEPVPLGAEGEIYIGGANVARGYLNRPDLTAERFLSDPFCSDDPGARMCRTGDRARYLPNGNLMFLGRIDQQVKIRGLRIELGEIEARLVEHRQVHEAIVQPYGDGLDKRLVAYVVADVDTLLVHSLRTYLSTLLPDYMVPAAYVSLPSLPITPNGKLNRQALPPPDDEAFARQQYEAPQGELEEKLAKIWCELLGIERISRHDNFFELGGHSLLVWHFVNKVKLFNMHIDAHGVFSFPILRNLAEQMNNRSKRFYCDAAIPIRQSGYATPLFLMPDGWGGISYAFELSHDIDRNIPVYVLSWSSPEKKQPSSLEEMASAMITLIKKVRPNGPCAIAGYSDGGILAYEISKQLRNYGYSVSFLGLIDTYPIIVNPLSETEIFLKCLSRDYPHYFKVYVDDSVWWSRVSKLTPTQVIEEIHKMSLDLSNIDIEWEALLAKQRYNYQNICSAFKIDSLPIAIHLFKAVDQLDNVCKENMDNYNKLFNSPKLGWENYNLSNDFNAILIDGNHHTMMGDPENRSLLGKELTKSLQL